MDHDSLIVILEQIFKEQMLIYAVLSGPKKGEGCQKVTFRPVIIKGQLMYQMTEFRQHQVIHQNLQPTSCHHVFEKRVFAFKQTFLYTSVTDYQILINKKGEPTILKKPPTRSETLLSHNRSKEYLLQEGHPIPFLIELGVMNPEGKVYAQKSDKYKQINRFLEMVDDIGDQFDLKQELRIIDFGCGKAYLTFALYYYLKVIKGFNVYLTGIDLKQDVIYYCQQLAQRLDYQQLMFQLGDINEYAQELPVDLVVSLHACDTATDAALEKAIRWEAKVILCVPCCQHELFNQVDNETLSPLLKHGILKERFASLATDAARAQLLDVLGYQTQLLEFIDFEHTPKNLLIRAIKRSKPTSEEAWKAYVRFKHHLKINPSLERRFNEELPDS